ncbi:Holliday junction branch migration protein RuvA [Candidatus Dependentiae bacterium]|nr:Holliday junction branch migration protein RuvA [Candidatus Dependentiae bacterium]
MIARLRGTILEVALQTLTLDVQGVGYQVKVLDRPVYASGSTVDLHIHFYWNQEQGPQLYGFDDTLSRDVFVALIGCSGCGPKLGLAALSHFKSHDFLQVIVTGDTKALSGVSGIGQKKAELIIMHLKDKVARFTSQIRVEEHASLKKLHQVQAALEALQYKKSEVAGAFEYLQSTGDLNEVPFDELLRRALSFLGKRF